MRRRIFPLIMVYLLMSCFIVSAVAIEPKAIIGRPVLKIEGTTAYCSGQYRSGNRNDQISMAITLKLNDKVIKSWSDSGTGSVIISETHTVERGKTYYLVLAATINGKKQPDVSVSARS